MWRHFLLSLNIQTGTCIMGIHRNKFPAPRQFYNPSDFFFKLGLSRGHNLNALYFTSKSRVSFYKVLET